MRRIKRALKLDPAFSICEGACMKKRRLGKSDLELAPLAFGGNVFGWTADEPMSFRLLDGFVDAAFNFIDTADVYSKWVPGNQGGESETIIGNWLKHRKARQKVLIASKLGMKMPSGTKGLSRAYILASAENSLKRLQTDYIDLYQAHVDDQTVPLEETLGAFDELIRQGKVRAIGASNYSGPRLAEALETSRKSGLPAYVSLQPLYNLYDRSDYETNLEPVCVKYGLGVISYFSLASGFLTGKYKSETDTEARARGERVKKYLNERGFRIVTALEEVAKSYRASAAQIALAWLIARPSITAPIASATTLEQMKELIEATQVMLDSAAMERLNRASREAEASSA
jgi:aryl-alcohol dehydrogenase-like predicted oxidoreductase